MRYRNGVEIKSFKPVDSDELAELWGFFLGDGYLQVQALCLYLKVNEEPYLLPLLRLLGYYRKRPFKLRKSEWATAINRYDVSNKVMAEEYRKHFYPKRVPEWMFQKSLDYRVRVVRGLFEAEGSVNVQGGSRRVLFCNTNKSIVDFVIKTLNDLNISFGYRQRAPTKNKTRYDIWLHKTGTEVFKSKIGFLTPEKNARLLC